MSEKMVETKGANCLVYNVDSIPMDSGPVSHFISTTGQVFLHHWENQCLSWETVLRSVPVAKRSPSSGTIPPFLNVPCFLATSPKDHQVKLIKITFLQTSWKHRSCIPSVGPACRV